MADGVLIRIGDTLYQRNPNNEGSVAALLIKKGVEPEKAYMVEEQCRLTAAGHKVPVKLEGIQITT